MNLHFSEVRRNRCINANCDLIDKLDYSDPCVVCPNGHWGTYFCMGLGDAIEAVAKPFARMIDAAAGTNLAGCGGCAKMKGRLNAGMSIPTAIKLRIQGK